MLQKIKTTHNLIELDVVVDNLLKNIGKRFPNVENNILLAQPTFLDPRFKKNGFTTTENLKNCKDSVLLSMNRRKTAEEAPEPAAPPIANTNSLWADFDKAVAATIKSSTSSNIIELRQYSEDEVLPRTGDPLLWWKTRELIYPTLAKIAKNGSAQ